jgi:hypothetical protein
MNVVEIISKLRVVIKTLWGMAGKLLRNISRHTTLMSITGDNPEKSLYTGPVQFVWGIQVTRNIASMDIQYKVGDAPDLQSGGGTAGAENREGYVE